ncbi:hypothetical protein HY621_04170, partial [Candidatus Uhrbacteria bacterium]|nr:hypothetical protein [Candidatus Uhrbacteria bacterium]
MKTLAKYVFCAFFFSILVIPSLSFAEENQKKDLFPKIGLESTSTPFLFTDISPKQAVPEIKKESLLAPAPAQVSQVFPSQNFLGSFITPKGELDVVKIVGIAIIIAVGIAFFIVFTGVFALISIFRESKKFSRKRICAISWNIFQTKRRFF